MDITEDGFTNFKMRDASDPGGNEPEVLAVQRTLTADDDEPINITGHDNDGDISSIWISADDAVLFATAILRMVSMHRALQQGE